MTTQQPKAVISEQKIQPVPSSSSDEMALDLDINGTLHRAENSGDAASNELDSTPAKLPTSPSASDDQTQKSVAVNGAINNAVFVSNTSLSMSPLEVALESQPAGVSSAVETSAFESSSQLPDTSPTTTTEDQQVLDKVEADVDEATEPLSSTDAAIDAAVEDATVTSTVLPIVEAQESDLRDASTSNAIEPDAQLAQVITPLDVGLSANADSAATSQNATDPVDQESSTVLIPEHPDTIEVKPAIVPNQEIDMTDAPQFPLTTKISREREDDEVAERAAKRAKTEADSPSALDTTNGAAEPLPNGDLSAVSTHAEPPITPYFAKEIIKHVKNAVRTADGKNFKLPVTDLWPQLAEPYAAKISRPMDLATLEKNLRANEYPTLKEVKEDVQLLHNNAITFNGPDHDVTKSAQRTASALLAKISNIPPEPMPAPKKEKKSKASTPVADVVPKATPLRRQSRGANTSTADAASTQTFALDPQSNTPLIRRDSTKAETGRPKRDIIPPKNKDLPYSVRPKSKKFAVELRWAQEALAELKKPKYAAYNFPFLTPVDPVALSIPTYFSVIKHPMDLATVEGKLDNGLYTTSKDFEKDIGLIISNCFKFNPPGNAVHDFGKLFDSLWKEQLSKKSRWISDHTPAVVSASPTPESEAEESEDELEAPPVNTGGSAIFKRLVEEQSKLIEIMSSPTVNEGELKLQQDMVNFLQRQVEAEKVAAPPAKKPKKAKAPKAPAVPSKKKSIPAPKASASKKSGGGRKDRYLGTLEKEVISMGIGSLPEHVADTVLKMIQNDRPDLGTEDDGTLELDIDMIATPTLWKIYELVKHHCPEIERDLRQSYEAKEAPRSAPKPATKKKNKPMNKYEQDQKIKQLEGTLQNFERQTSGSQEPLPTVEKHEQNDSSGDEDSDSEEE